MASTVFLYPLIIREMHLDFMGHVNNAAYFTILEEARWELMTQNNFGVEKIKQIGLGPVILDASIQYLKELKVRDEIVIQTQFLSYEKKVGKIKQVILRNDIECCIANFTFGLFSLKDRKLVLPTPEWIKALGG